MPKHYVTRLAAALRTGQGAERLYDEYGTGLFGYCWSMLGDATEAAGALTDTVLVATAHADALADPADLSSWVFALARNECLRRRPDAPPAASPYVCASGADVLTMLVARALTDLRPADRELLDLTVRHRMSTPQLALVLDVTEDDAAGVAEIAVTRFDQTLSTLFMASSGSLAVPHDLVADRPPLRVLLDLLPYPHPPADLRGNAAAACVDPELDHYRLMVARRVLPLGEAGFPHRLDPMRRSRGSTRLGVPPPASGYPPEPGPPAYGTRAVPLGAPVFSPAGHVPERAAGGPPVIEPVDPDLIPPDAVRRARTSAPAPAAAAVREAPEAAGRREAVEADGGDAGREGRAGAVEEPAVPRPRARSPRVRRRTAAQRFWYVTAVLLAMLAVAGGAWAAQQIFAPSPSGARVTPTATEGGAAPVRTAPPSSRARGHHHPTGPTVPAGAYGTPTATPSTPSHRRGASPHPGEVPPATLVPSKPAPTHPPTTHHLSRTPPKSHSSTPTTTPTTPGAG